MSFSAKKKLLPSYKRLVYLLPVDFAVFFCWSHLGCHFQRGLSTAASALGLPGARALKPVAAACVVESGMKWSRPIALEGSEPPGLDMLDQVIQGEKVVFAFQCVFSSVFFWWVKMWLKICCALCLRCCVDWRYGRKYHIEIYWVSSIVIVMLLILSSFSYRYMYS